tara:strand:+ start:566 stop:787 length:222 start_codon:yes stop_codon:yes gene_type:complete
MADRLVYGADGSITEENFTEEEKAAKIEEGKLEKVQIEANKEKVEKQITDKASGNQKLKDLGLTDDEIAALVG